MSQPKSSHVNGSRPMVTFTDYDHRESPYEGPAMRISLVADTLFVDFGKLTEERNVEKFERSDDNSIGVDAEALYQALGMMLRRDDREAYDRLREGTLPRDHPSLIPTHVAVQAPSVRTRA